MKYQTLLDTVNFRRTLEKMVFNSESEIIICSPFIKLKALEWLSTKIKKHIDVKIISRLSVSDITQKSSDFEICQFAIDNGWKIGLINNLHAKIYIIDKNKVLIGSNNLTPKGLGLEIDGNEEISIIFEPNNKSFRTINKILVNTHWLNQKTINLMFNHLSKNHVIDDLSIYNKPWPKEILDFKDKNYLLFSSNFPDLSPQKFMEGEKTLFLENITDYDTLKSAFKNSDVYLWLLSILQNSPTNESNFGLITSEIHKKILDNPLPYRSSIKETTNYLFQWVEKFSDEIIVIVHPNTKSMKLL